jgi:hypothetical protein
LPHLRVGSHIKVRRVVYYHHGIYIGRRQVIHYSGLSNNLIDKGQALIVRTPLQEFAGESEIEMVEYTPPPALFSKEKIVERAKKRVGEGKGLYHVIKNNCEHFATWCVTDKRDSKQITSVVLGGLAGLLFNNLIEW